LLAPWAAVHSTETALRLDVKPFWSVTSIELGTPVGVVRPVTDTDAAVAAPALFGDRDTVAVPFVAAAMPAAASATVATVMSVTLRMARQYALPTLV
jgi:hypothetical protein